MHMDSTRLPTDSLHAADANLPPLASAYPDCLSFNRVVSDPANRIKRRYWHHSELSLINSMNWSSDSQPVGPLIASPSPSIYAGDSMVDFNPGWSQNQQDHQAILAANASQFDANSVNPTTCCYAPPHDLGGPLAYSGDDPRSRFERLKRPVVNAIVNYGNKSCTCKRTNCLKLYCECFSNKYYCSEACACEGCYNTQEYEDSVQKSNEQIESRDQHALSARVTDHITSDLVRQRKGCNCKKSLCQKKYCECYQAGVGCSINCRCENCKNSHGIRNEYNLIAEVVYVRIRGEADSTDVSQGAIADVNLQENNTHLSALTAPSPSSMENEAPGSQNIGSYNPLPNSVPETIQGGTDSNSTRRLPDTNSAHHFDENKILPEPLISSRAGSAESDSRKPQSLQSDITQVGEPLSDHSNEDFQASN